MARVVAFIPDLLFGSRVQAMLDADGHVVELVSDASAVRDALTDATVLVVDLTDEALRRRGPRGIAVSGPTRLTESARSPSIRMSMSMSRRRAEGAGFDLVVPRSRMAREGAQLVSASLSRSAIGKLDLNSL